MIAISITLSVAIVCLTVLWVQYAHYKQRTLVVSFESARALSAELELKLKEFKTLEDKVNSLTLRAGFKL